MSPRLRRAERASTPEEPLPAPPRPAGRVLDARLHLLDRQVVDADGAPVAVVDDLELEPLVTAADDGSAGTADGVPTLVVTHLLSGPVLLTRVLTGRPPHSRWHRIAWRHVSDVGTVLRLGLQGDALDVLWIERWLREHVVGRIPGGRRAPE